MTSIERCRCATALAILVTCLASNVVFGQTVNVFNANRTTQEIQAGVLNGTLWPAAAAAQPSLRDCEQSRVIAFGPKSLNPARVRYEAAVRFRQCVAEVRSTVIAASGTDATTAALSFDSTDQLVTRQLEESAAETQFMGISFGVGVSYSEDERISEAELAADGTIRATKTETQEPRVILESHYYG